MHKIVAVVKRIIYSPWPYIVVVPPLAFYVGILLSNGLWNGWAGFVVALLTTVAIAWLGMRKRDIKSIRTVILIVMALIPIGFSGYLCIPSAPTTVAASEDFPETPTRHRNLPTGSNIAYYHLNGGEAAKEKPALLFLHGGPGGSVSHSDVTFFNQFTSLGYDTYLYDQVGSGRSDFIPAQQYSHQRNIDDLAAVLEKIPNDKVIMVGQSYGSTLLASALADPRISPRVAKAVFAEPGGLPLDLEQSEKYLNDHIPQAVKDNPIKQSVGEKQQESNMSLLVRPRILLGFFLMPTANNFITQEEATNLMGTKELNMHSQSSVCPDDRDSLPPITEKDGLRMNLKANVQVNNYKNYNFDMNAFSNNPTPGMLLIGECTYVNRRTQLAFETAYPAMERVHYFTGLGHHVLETASAGKPSRAFEAIRSFIEETPAPMPNYPREQDFKDFMSENK